MKNLPVANNLIDVRINLIRISGSYRFDTTRDQEWNCCWQLFWRQSRHLQYLTSKQLSPNLTAIVELRDILCRLSGRAEDRGG